jgi:hypothetical protein
MGEGTMVNEKLVQIGGQPYSVKKLVFAQRVPLMRIIAEELARISKEFPEFTGKASKAAETLAEGKGTWDSLRPMVELFGDRLADIYALITGASGEYIRNNLSISEEIALWKAFLEINDLPLLVADVRSILSSVKG